ncbi:MAG: hypothetical protein JSU98_01650 [Gemmatimonadales bacterium]|nr:MAG: hypothetical protein JSU98_01650 [Gemmatimonadales bacterium]
MNTLLVLGGLAWAAVPAVSFLDSPAFRCEHHPLARLAVEVDEGMALESVLARFEAYTTRSGPDAGGVAVLGDIIPTTPAGDTRVTRRILFIEDLWLDEALKLVAWFNGGGRVEGTRFLCDDLTGAATGG